MGKTEVTYNVSFAFRRDTYENLMKSQEIPKQGEPIFEMDTNKLKIGDGIHEYDKLKYFGNSEQLTALDAKITAFLADADISEAAVDTLKEIQEMLQNSEFDIAELVKKIAEFETLHSELNVAIEEANRVIVEHNQTSEQIHNLLEENITKVEKDFAAADQKIIEDANTKFDALDMDILVAKAEAVNEAKAYSDELSTKFAKADTELSSNLDKEIARATAAEVQNLTDAKSYTDKVKKDLLGEGISETFDTLVEIQDWINGDGVNATELASAIANEATNRQAQDTILSDRIDAFIAQHRTDIDTINSEFEKAYDQQTEAFNNYVSEVKAELEEDDRNNLAEAKSYTDAAKSALFGEGSANYDTIVKLSAKTQEIIDTHPTYVAEQIAISESNMKTYIDQKIGEIENGAY